VTDYTRYIGKLRKSLIFQILDSALEVPRLYVSAAPSHLAQRRGERENGGMGKNGEMGERRGRDGGEKGPVEESRTREMRRNEEKGERMERKGREGGDQGHEEERREGGKEERGKEGGRKREKEGRKEEGTYEKLFKIIQNKRYNHRTSKLSSFHHPSLNSTPHPLIEIMIRRCTRSSEIIEVFF
jgi:hypothetical protein